MNFENQEVSDLIERVWPLFGIGQSYFATHKICIFVKDFYDFYGKEFDSETALQLPPSGDALTGTTQQSFVSICKRLISDQKESVELHWESLELDFLKILASNPNLASRNDFPTDLIPLLIHALGISLTIASKTNKAIHVRIAGYLPITKLKEVKVNMVGKFVTIRGNVIRVSFARPLVYEMKFSCAQCKLVQTCHFPDGKYKAPTKCASSGCRCKTMIPDKNPGSAIIVDWQKIRIQEKLADDQADSGRVPRTVECELTRDMVNQVVPGDVVVLSGTLKVLSTDDSKGKNNSGQMYYMYIDANSMSKLSAGISSEQELNDTPSNGKDYIEFSKSDLRGIKEIMSYQGNLFDLLVHSLCPSIFGHLVVKAGLLLTLFGGRRRDQSKSIRSDPHILVVGDPGLGKSQMLLSTVKLAPRGVYVSGNMTSTAGLTVTVCKDHETGDTVLEAGALVLGDQGVCCIDEFDKMTDHEALLEAMEQQQISIAKAGMICSLPCRTSVIAAANPIGGHYDKSKTVADNLRMEPALLSRFDLVFILLDKPNEDMDRFLSDHIMKIHRKKKTKVDQSQRPRMDIPVTQSEESSLHERLKTSTAIDTEPIPSSLLRKFISYARTYSHPRLSEEAAAVIQSYYLSLRKTQRIPGMNPITTRQLESLIRLSEARARCELRDVVTAQDAQDVVEILQESLKNEERDVNQIRPISRTQGDGPSRATMAKNLIAALRNAVTCTGDSLFAMEDIKRLNGGSARTSEIVDYLNNQGLLLNKGGGLYHVI